MKRLYIVDSIEKRFRRKVRGWGKERCIAYKVEADSPEEAYRVVDEWNEDRILSEEDYGVAVDEARVVGVNWECQSISGPYDKLNLKLEELPELPSDMLQNIQKNNREKQS